MLKDGLLFTRSGFLPTMANLKTGVTLQGFSFMDTWQQGANSFGSIGPHQPTDKGNKKEAYAPSSKDLLIFTDSATFDDPLKKVRTLEGIVTFTWDKDMNKQGDVVYLRPIVQVMPAGTPEPGAAVIASAMMAAAGLAIRARRSRRRSRVV